MSKSLEIKSYTVENNSSYQTSSKSMLSTIKLGCADTKDLPAIPKPKSFVEKSLLKTTFKTGFEHNDTPVIPQPIVEFKQNCQKHEDSIISSIDTGFGECKTIEKDCPKPIYKSHLYKENYLSEFKTETEKALVRSHLGVYGKSETITIIKLEIGNIKSFIKKEEVEKMITDLDFVDSTLKAFANYQIPEKLFKL